MLQGCPHRLGSTPCPRAQGVHRAFLQHTHGRIAVLAPQLALQPAHGCQRRSAKRRTLQCRSAASSASIGHAHAGEGSTRVYHIAAAAARLWNTLVQPFKASLQSLQQLAGGVDWDKIKATAKHCSKTAKRTRVMLAAAPVAAGGSSYTLLLLTRAMAKFVEWYLLLLFVRVLLSWFPTFDWDRQPWLAIRQLTDPYLNLFRNIIPPLLGMMDFTPLLGFILLQHLQGYLAALSASPDQDQW